MCYRHSTISDENTLANERSSVSRHADPFAPAIAALLARREAALRVVAECDEALGVLQRVSPTGVPATPSATPDGAAAKPRKFSRMRAARHYATPMLTPDYIEGLAPGDQKLAAMAIFAAGDTGISTADLVDQTSIHRSSAWMPLEKLRAAGVIRSEPTRPRPIIKK